MPLGVDVTRVDTVAAFPIGYECEDPRGGIFAGNKCKYVKANGTITAADIVKIDITATAADRRGVVIRTAAAAEPIEGIALVSLTANQFGWISTLGLFQNANVTTGAVAGAILSSSGTAGRAITSPGAAADANANAGGRRLLNLVLAASNVADVLIGG